MLAGKAALESRDTQLVELAIHSLSRVRLVATSWTVAHQAPLSMGFSRQEYWSGLPLPPPGDLPNPGIKPASLTLGGKFLTITILCHPGSQVLES